MVKTPPEISFNAGSRNELAGFIRQGRAAGSRILNFKQLLWKSTEIMDRGRAVHRCYIGSPRLPVRRDAQYRMRPGNRSSCSLPSSREFILLNGIHRAAMTQEQHGHRLRAVEGTGYLIKLVQVHFQAS